MARTIKIAKLETRTARARLKRGRQAHWNPLGPGTHLGYQRQAGAGRWLLRRYLGGGNTYRVVALGTADDLNDANGTTILSYEQASAKARAMTATPDGDRVVRMTVRQAFTRYVEHKATQGQAMPDVVSRGKVHILPTLGDYVVSELTAETLRRWLANMAAGAAQVRPRDGQPQYRSEPQGDEAIRKRRATANRVLTMLKAILNFAYDEGHVTTRDTWGRKLKKFRDVETARVRYLTIAEAKRLINASELARLEVVDFNSDSGTITVRKSKTGKSRHIILTEEGAGFFRAHCAGRAGGELMFTHDDRPWKASEQTRPMTAANSAAKLRPTIGFHGLRHTWASHAVMNGVPLLVVAKNLGHADTKMVEKHYGHLASSYIVDAIRAGAPKFGIAPDKKVVPLR
jgi:integrase